MADVLNSLSLAGVAASLCEVMGIEPPREANPSLPQLTGLVKRQTRSGRVDRVFMYNPDAVALWVYQKYTSFFDAAWEHAQLALPLRSVMPSVTPVCFGTMYTGACPEVHGIRRYEKPVIRIDTIFDALIRAGRRPVILGDPQCSLCHIFLERDMDYFPIEGIDAINEKAMALIEEDKYDFMVVYNGDFDATMHKTGPESDASLEALRGNVRSFDAFARAIRAQWTGHDTLLAFAMDHGCHEIDGGCGSHGLDMPEDLNILHLYGVIPRAE